MVKSLPKLFDICNTFRQNVFLASKFLDLEFEKPDIFQSLSVLYFTYKEKIAINLNIHLFIHFMFEKNCSLPFCKLLHQR